MWGEREEKGKEKEQSFRKVAFPSDTMLKMRISCRLERDLVLMQSFEIGREDLARLPWV